MFNFLSNGQVDIIKKGSLDVKLNYHFQAENNANAPNTDFQLPRGALLSPSE